MNVILDCVCVISLCGVGVCVSVFLTLYCCFVGVLVRMLLFASPLSVLKYKCCWYRGVCWNFWMFFNVFFLPCASNGAGARGCVRLVLFVFA
jgi:hypothetical protein